MVIAPKATASLDAEYSVIGALLIDPSIAGKLFAVSHSADFTRAELQTIYNAAHSLFVAGRPVDPVTIRAAVGVEYEQLLRDCMEVTPAASLWRTYVQTMQEQTRVQRIRELAAQLGQVVTSGEARDLIVKAGNILTCDVDDRVASAEQLVQIFFMRQTQKPEFISYGIGRLDKRVYTELGDMIVLAGRPSAGKTAMAIQMASVMGSKYRVGFFSLETSREKIADRWIANQCMINFSDIKHRKIAAQDMERVVLRKNELAKMNFEVVKAAGMTVDDIADYALTRRYDIIFVDYLQLVRGRGKDRYEQVTNVSAGLHTLAGDHKITVVALSQLSRNGAGAKPKLTDLRESGQIEQDADAIFLLYLADEDDPQSDRYLLVAKNKEGGLGEIRLVFDGAKQGFIEYMEEPKRFTKLPHYKRQVSADLKEGSADAQSKLPGA